MTPRFYPCAGLSAYIPEFDAQNITQTRQVDIFWRFAGPGARSVKFNSHTSPMRTTALRCA